MTAYTLADAARILKISPARLRYWERTSLVEPSLALGATPAFGFRDLVCVKAILALLERGVPLRRIRACLAAIRERVPDLDCPVGALRVWVEGSERIVIRHDGALFEPNGQMVIDFSLARAGGDEVRALGEAQPPSVERNGRETALDWFERGCCFDSDPARGAEAADAYRRAIEADPEFADAHCNLGTIHYNRNRRAAARECFERALGIDPRHVEAHFNLANLLEEEGRKESALRHLKATLAADPVYADAHLNLALLYEKLGLRRRAREHWRRYAQLDPSGPWADVARQRLQD